MQGHGRSQPVQAATTESKATAAYACNKCGPEVHPHPISMGPGPALIECGPWPHVMSTGPHESCMGALRIVEAEHIGRCHKSSAQVKCGV
eukprot:235330-Chlamydomonas_euryale.AAC.1